MRERALAVLRCYAQAAWSWSGLAGFLLSALLWGTPMFLAGFTSPLILPRRITLYSALIVIPVALTIGRHLASQFRSYRARLMPGHAVPHVAVGGALLLGFVVLAVVAILALFPQLNYGPVSGAVWLCANLGLLAGYAIFPAELGTAVLAPVLLGLIYIDSRGLLDYGGWPLLALNAAVTAVFFRDRFRWRNERVKVPGVAFSIGTPPSPEKLDATLERYQRWIDALLDPMPPRLGPGLFARARHVALGVSSLPISFGRLTAYLTPFFAVLLLGSDFFLGEPRGPSSAGLFNMTMFPVVMMATGQGSIRKRLQWLALLPLRKGDIVLMYGYTLLRDAVKWWAAFAMAGFIAVWATSAVNGHGTLPPVLPFLGSLATLPAMLGMATLLQSWGRSLGWALMSAVPFMGVLVVLHDVVGENLVYGVLPAGLLLCWASYTRWCRVQFD